MKKTRLKVLVTGGAGFVGSHLCRRLIDDGCEVLCADNFSTGRRRHLHALLTEPNFRLLRHDVTMPLDVRVDQIYNLACPASPSYYRAEPIQTARTNALGAINILNLARRTKARVLQASTSEIYGDPEQHPQPEIYWGRVNPIGPRACYDEGKRYAEALFFDYHRQHQVDIRVARIFNTYGPYMQSRDGRVISNFICQALADQDITVYGDGSQTRSFQFIDDLIEGLIKLMNNDRGFVGPVNLGNPQEISISTLADKVLSLIPNSSSKVVYGRLPGDDPRRRRPDIRLAERQLDWRPIVGLDQGLKRTIAYFRQPF